MDADRYIFRQVPKVRLQTHSASLWSKPKEIPPAREISFGLGSRIIRSVMPFVWMVALVCLVVNLRMTAGETLSVAAGSSSRNDAVGIQRKGAKQPRCQAGTAKMTGTAKMNSGNSSMAK
jgi:hypothetical protein